MKHVFTPLLRSAWALALGALVPASFGDLPEYREAVADDRPVRYYQLEDTLTDNPLDVIADTAGNANGQEAGSKLDSTVQHAPGFIAGSLAFDFRDQFAAGPNDAGFTVGGGNPLNTGPFTIEFWIRQPPITALNCCGGQWWGGIGLVDGERSGAGNDFGTSLLEVGGSTRLAFGCGNPETTVVTPNPIDDDAWHHVVAVYTQAQFVEGKNLFLYVDGTLVASAAGGTAVRDYTTEIRVGEHPPDHPLQNNPFTGLLDEIALYDKALGPDRVTAHYTNGIVIGAPVVEAHPLSQTVAEGVTVTFTVAVRGSEPLRYQWRKDATDMDGQTAASLTLDNVTLADGGEYRVVVTNAYGTVTSLPAVLRVGSQGELDIAMYAGITLRGTVGFTYEIQFTPALGPTNWTALTNIVLPSSPYLFIDLGSAQEPHRYYRSRLIP